MIAVTGIIRDIILLPVQQKHRLVTNYRYMLAEIKIKCAYYAFAR